MARQNQCVGRLIATRVLRNKNKIKKQSLDSSRLEQHQNKTKTMNTNKGSGYWWHPTLAVIPTPSLHLGVGTTSWWPPHTLCKWHEAVRTPTSETHATICTQYLVIFTCSPAVFLDSEGQKLRRESISHANFNFKSGTYNRKFCSQSI